MVKNLGDFLEDGRRPWWRWGGRPDPALFFLAKIVGGFLKMGKYCHVFFWDCQQFGVFFKMGAARDGVEEEAQTARWWGLRGAPVTYWASDTHAKQNLCCKYFFKKWKNVQVIYCIEMPQVTNKGSHSHLLGVWHTRKAKFMLLRFLNKIEEIVKAFK